MVCYAYSNYYLLFLIERSAWGNSIYMIGSNEVAARFSGIKTKQCLMKVYLLSGVLAGIAGVFITSRYNSAKVDYGSSYMMQSVTAVVLGGNEYCRRERYNCWYSHCSSNYPNFINRAEYSGS